MSFDRPLRGGCHCGRNRYVVAMPAERQQTIQVIFDPRPSHRHAQATPLPAFIRVPLEHFHSSTIAFFPDETSTMIRKVYEAPHGIPSKRQFCGFCGTPLTYWSESPRTEADFIQLTLGSLNNEDLHDLEELGLLPDHDEEPTENKAPEAEARASATPAATVPTSTANANTAVTVASGRETLGGLPWLDTLVSGSRLGTMRRTMGTRQSHDGRVTMEWEVAEWTADNETSEDDRPAKRKLGDRDDDAGVAMEGVQH